MNLPTHAAARFAPLVLLPWHVCAFAQSIGHDEPPDRLEEIVVTTSREGTLRMETPTSVSVIGGETIEALSPAHPSEIMNRVPGVSVQKTQGEGHITGIRQPVGTDPVYLYLEDGVPVRPSGFFNHNALFELNLLQAADIEVTRGPGTALHGSDAIGGIVNVLTRAPAADAEGRFTLEAGSWNWLRGYGGLSRAWGDTAVRLDLNLTHSDGWRNASGYDRQSLAFRADKTLSPHARLKATVSVTRIDQETGANSRLLEADYRQDPRQNDTPIGFRKASSVRAVVDWEYERGETLLSVVPYLRWSELELLPTWMLGFDPVVYTSGYASAGMLLRARRDFEPLRTRLIVGADLEYSPGFREEDRIETVREGRVFTDYTRQDRIYDYDARFWQGSPYVQIETSPLDRLRITAGLRFDWLGFRYANDLDDGPFTTITPFGPRTFNRPGDADIRYSNVGRSVGATYRFHRGLHGFVSFKESFRVPQEGQLFRQGGNASSVDLEPVQAASYEAGLRGLLPADLLWELTFYRMIKKNDILSTDFGTGPSLTNNGETRHEGIEAAVSWVLSPEWQLEIAASHAEHVFHRWSTADGVDFSGNAMSAAPRTLANTTLAYAPGRWPALTMEAEWTRSGSYWLDNANTVRYPGHDLFNLRANFDPGGDWRLFVRVSNLADTRWATAGAVSAGRPELVPGTARSFFAGISREF